MSQLRIEELVEQLQSGSSDEGQDAFDTLKDFGEAILPTIARRFSGLNEDGQVHAVDLISEFDSHTISRFPALLEPLLSAVSSANEFLASNAISVLIDQKDRRVIPYLVNMHNRSIRNPTEWPPDWSFQQLVRTGLRSLQVLPDPAPFGFRSIKHRSFQGRYIRLTEASRVIDLFTKDKVLILYLIYVKEHPKLSLINIDPPSKEDRVLNFSQNWDELVSLSVDFFQREILRFDNAPEIMFSVSYLGKDELCEIPLIQ